MRKLGILVLLLLLSMTYCTAQKVSKTEEVTKPGVQEFKIEYQVVIDTVQIVAVVFDKDYLKRTILEVIIERTTPQVTAPKIAFYTTVGVPGLVVDKRDIFMYLSKNATGEVNWVTP